MSSDPLSKLHDPSVMIVLSYAQTGLGHLRVTDALYRGLPESIHPLTLHSQDESISAIHRVMTINTVTRTVLEWAQQGTFESIFTSSYRGYLRSHTQELTKQVLTLLNVRFKNPRHVVFVTTHFFLSHQLAEIKPFVEKKTGMKISVIVQVTDDSPQLFWYVPGADLTVVPSFRTKKALEAYGRRAHLPPVRFVVAPYPISPNLAKQSLKKCIEERRNQLDPDSSAVVHCALPISGAAVGLSYLSVLVRELHARDRRFLFHVVSKDVPFTSAFLRSMKHKPFVTIASSTDDKQVVEAYEQLYQDTTIALEVTKPSEQAFKTLVTPHHNGGAIMLFATPAGRQEYDNIDFMRRHMLIPTIDETELMWDMAFADAIMDASVASLFKKLNHYRGVLVPENPHEAVQFIYWSWKRGMFAKMMEYKKPPLTGNHQDELGGNGVMRFWEEVAKII